MIGCRKNNNSVQSEAERERLHNPHHWFQCGDGQPSEGGDFYRLGCGGPGKTAAAVETLLHKL